ncbi:RNA 2',3'-cyclic phosphodiesterase [Metabacillus sp. FJAT-53654]|uniref:RNA 2',3'-cyclic phosphodiesterase n=1 Tax=Metabacillus rhizosphaerae TaxID=3117747 RepID=A0ABZ2MYL6_9BACI
MKHQTHFFIAVPIEIDLRKAIHNWLANNKGNLPFQSWVHQEDYHITLAFLGHIDADDQLKRLSKLLKDKIVNLPPFSLSVKGLGVFGKKDTPRIFWAGIEDSSSLIYLQKQVFHACQEIGFNLDSKPFRPHITLARRWKSDKPFVTPELFLEAIHNEHQTFIVKEIHLYQTHLDRFPKYEAIDVFHLKGDK